MGRREGDKVRILKRQEEAQKEAGYITYIKICLEEIGSLEVAVGEV